MSQGPLVEVYFGTYTKPGKSEGIYQSVLNLESGQMSEPRLAAKTYNPSFILMHPRRQIPLCNRGGKKRRGQGLCH